MSGAGYARRDAFRRELAAGQRLQRIPTIADGGARQRIALVRDRQLTDADRQALDRQALDALIARVLHRSTIEQRTSVAFRVAVLGECLAHAIGAIAGVVVADCGGDLDPSSTGPRFSRCCGAP